MNETTTEAEWNAANQATERAAFEAERAEARDQRIAAHLHAAGGGDRSGMARAEAAVGLTHARLGLTERNQRDAEQWLGIEGATELARSTGEALSMLDPDMTPAEARERVRELRTDRGFFIRLEAGDVTARKLWDGVNALAASGR